MTPDRGQQLLTPLSFGNGVGLGPKLGLKEAWFEV